jgi:predicted  nucleic acid-binding Zn-ribbon protein
VPSLLKGGLSEPRLIVPAMTTVRERLTDLEARVKHLEDTTTPGRVDALGETSVDTRRRLQALQEGLADFRGEMAEFSAEMTEFRADMVQFRDDTVAELTTLKADVTTLKADVTTLKADVTTLKVDMTEVKGALREVLNRLPPSA